MSNGREPTFFQDVSAIELFSEPLKDHAVARVSMIDLPEAVGTAAVEHFVIMVERPDAIFRYLENGASQNTEGEPQNEIEVVIANVRKVAVGEVLGISTTANRP